MSKQKQRGLSLIVVSLVSMSVAVIAMAFIYYLRNGHLPIPEFLQPFFTTANAVSKDLKNATGIGTSNGSGMREAATTAEGVRRCVIDGKTVYSDTLCTDKNPSTKKLKLNDAKGIEPPKSVASQEKEKTGEMSEEQMKQKIMEQAVDGGKK
ncbi:hypothetical protein [Undibacterium sp. TJN19]|uniref:hypothetical protein n=1 Tax=Undibacterium sp. TJN19 TaxID=3413055 RepID=UPI003BF0C4F2